MNKTTKAIAGFTIGALIGTCYSTYELYKYTGELETQNADLRHDLWDQKTNYIYLKNSYKTLYDNMTDAELLQFRLNFPFSIPKFIRE